MYREPRAGHPGHHSLPTLSTCPSLTWRPSSQVYLRNRNIPLRAAFDVPSAAHQVFECQHPTRRDTPNLEGQTHTAALHGQKTHQRWLIKKEQDQARGRQSMLPQNSHLTGTMPTRAFLSSTWVTKNHPRQPNRSLFLANCSRHTHRTVGTRMPPTP